MKKLLLMALSLVLVLGLIAGCTPATPTTTTSAPKVTETEPPKTEAPEKTEPTDTDAPEETDPPAETDPPETEPAEETDPPATGDKVYNIANLVNGNLGDKSFFDSAYAGLQQLEADGRIKFRTIEMGGRDEDQPKWLETLYDVAESGEYDLIICGTYQMPEYLTEVAAAYPDQKFLIYDSQAEGDNIVNINYKQNDMGYLIGIVAAGVTADTSIDKINEDSVIGFVGGVDSPVINDFLYGFLLGAQSVNEDIMVDTRYVNNYVDPAKGKELATSMINDKGVDVVWGVAGLSGNGAAEAAEETGKAWFIGVDSDQELTLSKELAAVTLTSGLKNIGNSIIWYIDELDAGREHYGDTILLGLTEGGVGIVTDKNFDKIVPENVKQLVKEAEEKIAAGELEVPTAIGLETKELEELRDKLQP